MKSITLQLAVLLWAHAGAIYRCPFRCTCDTQTADCNSLELPQPPQGSWPFLRILDLTNNHITVLHNSSFVGYRNVFVLYLSGNNIDTLDFAHFALLDNLRYLSLWGNGLTSIEQPTSEVQLPILQQLDLSNNKLSELDPNLLATVAPNLQSLYFTDNRFFVLQDGPVLIHPKLQHVSFLRTKMSGTSPETFQHLPNLISLVLTETGVDNITGAFEMNRQLTFLELTGCAVEEVAIGTFAAGGKLSYLSLDANPLQWLELEAVELAMRRGGFLQISDTPLACACGYDDIHNWAIDLEVEVSASCKDRAPALMEYCPF